MMPASSIPGTYGGANAVRGRAMPAGPQHGVGRFTVAAASRIRTRTGARLRHRKLDYLQHLRSAESGDADGAHGVLRCFVLCCQ
ncbi:MAG: hypothetical protein WA895_29770, partial [Streptosporangiaceae bacterium]